MKTINLSMLIFGILFMIMACNGSKQEKKEVSWKSDFHNELNFLGHRNWILVVDKAFPEQTSSGMKYLYSNEELLPTLQYVQTQIESTTHVRPIIFRDKELSFITEQQVKGVSNYRLESEKLFKGRNTKYLLHEEVFEQLDKSSSLFKVLVIKTNGTMPYSSVFIQLDCGYWDAERESVLRNKMKK
jgi:D-ribose pyranose/furanose isomerase RbsD